MFDLNILPLAANGILLIVLSLVEFKRPRSWGIVLIFWTALIVGIEYAVLAASGAAGPLFQLFSVKFPLVLTPLISVGMILLLRPSVHQRWTMLGLFVFLMLVAGSRPGMFEFSIAASDNSVFERIFLQIVLSIAFIWCVLIPYVCLSDDGGKPWNYHIRLTWSMFQKDLKPVLIGTLLFVCVFVATNLVYRGYAVRFFWLDPFSTLVVMAVLNLFYIAVLEQTLCFGFTKKMIDKFLPNESPSLWEIVVFAGLYASLYYYFRPGAILSQFGYGLALGYMFHKTRSLGYGIALSFLVKTFTV